MNSHAHLVCESPPPTAKCRTAAWRATGSALQDLTFFAKRHGEFSPEIFMRSTKPRISFIPRPSDEKVDKFDRTTRARKFSRRPNRRSKLLPYLESICLCVQQGRSCQGIADFLLAIHEHRVNQSSVYRFIKKHPFLSRGRVSE